MLRPVLLHYIHKLIVHICLNPLGRVFFLRCFFTDDLRLHRTACRERTHHGLRLKLHQRLRQQRVVDTTGTLPRLSPLFNLHTQQLKPVHVGLYPVLTGGDVIIKVAN